MKRISPELFLVILIVVLFGYLVFKGSPEGFITEGEAGEPLNHECPDGQAYDFEEKRCKDFDGPRLS